MHLMVGDLLFLDRTEGPQSYVERYIGQIYAHGLYLLQQFPCKVKSCGRGCSRTHLFGIDSLIPLGITEFFLDIGRQGHLAESLQDLQKDPVIIKADQTVPPLQCLHDFSGEQSIPK